MAFLPASPYGLATPRGSPQRRTQQRRLRVPPPPLPRCSPPHYGARAPAATASAGASAPTPPPPAPATPLLADTTKLAFSPTAGTTTPAAGEATLLDVALRVGALRVRPGDDDWCRTGGCYRCEVEVSPGGAFVRSCQVPIGPAAAVAEGGGEALGGGGDELDVRVYGGGGDDDDDDDGWDVV